MTGRNTPSPDSVLHLVKEAGVEEDPALLEVVRDIAALAERPAPEPSAELAQLMAGGGKAPGSRRTKGRITFIGGALAVSMGVGMSGVAAGPVDRHEDLSGSIDSVSRFWARDHVDRITPAPVAGAAAVAPTSSDATAPAPADGSTPQSPGADGQASSGGMLGADTSEVVAALPPALPAARSAVTPVPSPNRGMTVPSPSRQSAPGTTTSASGTPASGEHASDARASGPLIPDSPASVTRGGGGSSDVPASVRGGAGASDPHDGGGTSVTGPRDAGSTSEPGIAQIPGPGGHLPQYVEEPMRFATLAWVKEGPDESMSDEAAPLMAMRTRGPAPENIVFLSQPVSDDGPWLAMFIADDTVTTWVPDAGEDVPEAESWEYAPEVSSDAAPSADVGPTTSRDVAPGTESPGASDAASGASDGAAPSPDSSPEDPSEESVRIDPKRSVSDAASAEDEWSESAPGQESLEETPSEDVPSEDVPTGSVPIGSVPTGSVPTGSDPAGSVPTGSVPTGSDPAGSVPTGSVPTASDPAGPTPTPTSPVPVEEPSGMAPEPGTSPDEPSRNPSETSDDVPAGELPAVGLHQDAPAG